MKFNPPKQVAAPLIAEPQSPSYVDIGFKLGFGGAFGLFLAYLLLSLFGCVP